MEIKLFSKWRPSAILNSQKLQFWSRDLYQSKLCINQPIWHLVKKRFSIWRPSAILNLQNFDFCQKSILGMEICICIPNLIKIGQVTAEIWR